MNMTPFRTQHTEPAKILRDVTSYLIRHSREMENVLKKLRDDIKNGRMSMEEIVDGVLASERVLNTIYNYCEKRRRKEEEK